MGLAFQFRFWVQVQCFRPCDRDQHALTQVHHPCHLTNPTNRVHLMSNNSSSAFASDVKINTALLNFGNGKGCVYIASWDKKIWISMGGSGLDRTDDFQKFCGSGLDRIQLLRIRIGLGLKNFTVCSSLIRSWLTSYSSVKIHSRWSVLRS